MGEGHSHSSSSRLRLAAAAAIAVVVLVAEVVGGIASQSLALLSDAGHMAVDTSGLMLALAAATVKQRYAKRSRATAPRFTFGLGRVEVLAALINAAALTIVAGWIGVSAVVRLRNGTDTQTATMLAVAILGLVANLVMLAILRTGQERTINEEGAYLEVLADTVGSFGVIAAGLADRYLDWGWADPVVAIAIACWVLPRSWRLAGTALRILLDSAPSHIAVDEVRSSLLELPGVIGVHDLHVWTVASGEVAIAAHIGVEDGGDGAAVLRRAKAVAIERFAITHQTFQLETPEECGVDCLSDDDLDSSHDHVH